MGSCTVVDPPARGAVRAFVRAFAFGLWHRVVAGLTGGNQGLSGVLGSGRSGRSPGSSGRWWRRRSPGWC